MHGRVVRASLWFGLAVSSVFVVVSVIAVNFHQRTYKSQSFLQSAPAPGSFIVSTQTVGSVGAVDPSAAAYEISITCSPNPSRVVAVSIPRGEKRTIGVTEFPGLTSQDRCSVLATGVEGAQVTYATSQPARADGSIPDPLPGVVEAGVYRSAPALSDGRNVTVTYSYVGDLSVTSKVVGAPVGSSTSSTITVRCANSGFVSTNRIADGQTRLITNIPAESICRVTTDQTNGVSFTDNSDDPRDGVVRVSATPARCWDLRTSTPDCRATVVVTSSYNGAEEPTVQNTQPTTTTPQEQKDPVQNAQAAVVAPAPVEEPAILDDSAISLTG